MRWSWKLGTIKGIDINIHVTFIFLLAWVLFSGLGAGNAVGSAIGSVLFVGAIFGTVVLHELGHALTARRFGIPTRDITLWPIGGVARLEKMPEQPKQELAVALAGPAVNVALAGAIWMILAFANLFVTPFVAGWPGQVFLARLLTANIVLAVFNLLPAFPMDGGRVVRALLAMRLDYVRATEIAATVGKAMAVVFGLVGLFFNPMLILIAFFVWTAASSEAFMTHVKYRNNFPFWQNWHGWRRSHDEPVRRYEQKPYENISDATYSNRGGNADSWRDIKNRFESWLRKKDTHIYRQERARTNSDSYIERRQTPFGEIVIVHHKL